MLGTVTTITPGYAFRSRVDNEPEGTVIVVQARDLGADGTVILDDAARVAELPVKTALAPGDVIFQPRGGRFTAAVFGGAPLPAVAAAPLYQIRPDPSRLLPEFLVAALMSSTIQSVLRQAAVGTHVPQVPRQALEELAIELPDLLTQAKLADLARLMRQERELSDRLRLMRERQFDLAMTEVSRKARR